MNKWKSLCYYSIVAVILNTACNPDKPAEEPLVLDTATPGQQQDTAIADSPAVAEEVLPVNPTEEAVSTPLPKKEAPKQRPQEKPVSQQPDKTPPLTQNTAGLKEGTYQLAQVQGERLPLVLDMTTECETKLQSATLSIRNGRFQFQSLSAEDCEGQSRRQEKHEASGSYRLEGNRLFLNVTTGEVLGDAIGVVEGNKIQLQQISNDEEQQEVDWVFKLQ